MSVFKSDKVTELALCEHRRRAAGHFLINYSMLSTVRRRGRAVKSTQKAGEYFSWIQDGDITCPNNIGDELWHYHTHVQV